MAGEKQKVIIRRQPVTYAGNAGKSTTKRDTKPRGRRKGNMAKENGYIGRIPNSGNAQVQAPNQTVPPKHSNVQKGKDLRTGK
jgi:hypothetical protein